MDCFIWGNKIIVPVKHGTRYCASIFQDYFSEIQNPIVINSEIWYDNCTKNTIEYVILRKPKDLLFSAVNTEVLSSLNNISGDFILHPSIQGLKKSISDVLISIIHGYKLSHYDKNFYEIIYNLSLSNTQLKIVPLELMTNFCKMITNIQNLLENNTKNFDFSDSDYFISKKLIWKIIENDFKQEYEELLLIIEKQENFYNKLEIQKFS